MKRRESSNIRCSSCGREMSAGFSFCPGCGTQVEEMSQRITETQESDLRDGESPVHDSWFRRNGIWIAGAALIAIISLIIIFTIPNNNANTISSDTALVENHSSSPDTALGDSQTGRESYYEVIMPTREQALMAMEAYQDNMAIRSFVDGSGDETAALFSALSAQALEDRLPISSSIATIQASIYNSSGTTRDRYEAMKTSNTGYTSGVACGDVDAPIRVLDRMAEVAFGAGTTFYSLNGDPSAQQDLINIGVTMFIHHTKADDERSAVVTQRALEEVDRYMSGRLPSNLSLNQHLYYLKDRLNRETGMDLTSITDAFLVNLGYVQLAMAANNSVSESVSMLGVSSDDAAQLQAATMGLWGFSQMSASDMGLMLTRGDFAVRLQCLHGALDDRLLGRVTVDGQPITSEMIQQLFAGDNIGNVAWVVGTHSSAKAGLENLIRYDEFTPELAVQLLPDIE